MFQNPRFITRGVQTDIHREYDIGFSAGGVPVVSKLFAIDDGDHSTLLLASEY